MDLLRRRREEDDVSINLTPLIDVVFLLLIFFMVSTSFVKEAELEVELPSASAQPAAEPPARIEVQVDRDGRYAVDGRLLASASPAMLRTALRQAAEKLKDPVLVIEADAEASHQSVVNVLDAARRVGLLRISFATEAAADG